MCSRSVIFASGEVERQMESARLFTIGHSNHDLDRFLALLQSNGVTAVADVRSRPYSRRLPHFNRPWLESELAARDFVYVFLGDLLGGRPTAAELYDEEGRVVYERVRETAAFQRGLEHLLQGMQERRIALMCSEEDPLDCHRGLMITPALVERGVAPLHLRKDGSAETTAAVEQRLLKETQLDSRLEPDLFRSATDTEVRCVLAEAYAMMGRKKAYRIQAESDESEV
jgi:uncharacterized protein (DUF488 family)